MPVCGSGLATAVSQAGTRRAPRRGTRPATRTTLTSRSITSSVMLVCGTRSVCSACSQRGGSRCGRGWCYPTCDKAYIQEQSIASSVMLVCGTRSVRSAPACRCSSRPCRLVHALAREDTAVKTLGCLRSRAHIDRHCDAPRCRSITSSVMLGCRLTRHLTQRKCKQGRRAAPSALRLARTL